MTNAIISDCHNLRKQYLNIVDRYEETLQIGDMSFDYKWLNALDPSAHSFFHGNHDNLDVYADSPHALGRFGQGKIGVCSYFYIAGGFSLDKSQRLKYERETGIKTWWEDEQLTEEEMGAALEEYCRVKPDILITHAVPKTIADMVGNPSVLKAFGFDPNTFVTRTQSLLDACLREHKVKIAVHGHMHMDRTFQYKGTLHVILDELQAFEIDENGNFNHGGYEGCLKSGEVTWRSADLRSAKSG